MHHHRLKHIKETLLCAIEAQLCNLNEVDTCELGEAIDMIKDLEEAIYYCTVTEAMTSGEEIEWGTKKSDRHHDESGNGRMYSMGYRYPMKYDDDGEWDHLKNDKDWETMKHGGNVLQPDEREGRSPKSRKMYMEAREMKRDKATQLRELEKYMQELSQDIVEMIAEASPEEKQYLEKKITALASKVGQMK